jgi:hypothetical protein
VACLIFAMLATTAMAAGSYTISWSGTIGPNGSSDPWGLGVSPVEFVVAVDVPLTSVDMSPFDAPNALFDLTSSRLWLGGQPASFVGPASINFTEGGVGGGGSLLPDLISFWGDFAFNGNQGFFSSIVGIDRSSFAFTQLIEFPPFFDSTVVVAPGQSVGPVYQTSVPLGTAVTVVPEPTGVWLSLGILSALALRRRVR